MRSMEKISEYAAALSTLLKTKPLKKIRVNDICKQCGTDRQNFYYYFKDKYDLAAWIYKLDYIEVIRNNSNSFSEKQLTELMEKLRSKSDIYINLFENASQNSLYFFVIASEYELFSQMKKEKNGTDKLSDEEKGNLVFKLSGYYDNLIAWLRGEYSFSAAKFAELMWIISRDFINKYYIDYEFKSFSREI